MNEHREYPETKKKPPKGSDVIEGIKEPQMAKGAIESEPRSKPEDYDRRAPPIMSLRPPTHAVQAPPKPKAGGRPRGKPSQATITVFKDLLERFARGEVTFGVVYAYMRRIKWLSKSAPELQFIIRKEASR